METLEISSRKLRDTKGTFHAKMGTIKDRNVMDISEAEFMGFMEFMEFQKQKILKRGSKNTQKNYTKKIFMTQITTMV